MGKSSGGVRNAANYGTKGRTGPGFTEPITGPTTPSSTATEVQYVYVDKITGNESDGYKNEAAVRKAIIEAERNDRNVGIYEKDNYYITRIEQLKGRGRASKYYGW